MWTNVNNSFTVALSDEVQIKMVPDLPTHLKYVAHYLGKIECYKLHSLFIHITKQKEWFNNI